MRREATLQSNTDISRRFVLRGVLATGLSALGTPAFAQAAPVPVDFVNSKSWMRNTVGGDRGRISPDAHKNRGRTAKTSPATSISFPQDRRRSYSTYAAAEAVAAVGTDAIVFRICDAIWYGSPCEFGRRSSR
jgi:hypothetical protein